MSGKVFVDTNILIYTRDSSEPEKQVVARQWMANLWERRMGCLSYQSFNEYYVIATQRLNPGLSVTEARRDLELLQVWNPIAVDQAVIENGWRIQDEYHFSWWDCLILSAAQIQGCQFILSEDFQHEQRVHDLIVLNPFTSDLTCISG